MEFLIIIALVAMVIFGWVGWAIGRDDQAVAWSFWGIGMLVVSYPLAGEVGTGFNGNNLSALICCFLLGIPGLLGFAMGASCARRSRRLGQHPTEG